MKLVTFSFVLLYEAYESDNRSEENVIECALLNDL